MTDRKPFKETGLGKFLTEKVPSVLDIVGNVLPDKGMLGVIKNIIDKQPDLPEADRLQFQQLIRDHELELEKLELADRSNARQREVEIAKTNKHDWLMYLVGSCVLLAFMINIYASIWLDVHGDIFVRSSTMVETLTVCLVSYYYGSSKGSADKNKQLQP